MNLLGRLVLLTLLVCTVFGSVYWFELARGRDEVHAVLRELSQERAARLDTAINFRGAGLAAIVSSYAWWDDMVKYMETRDDKWAASTVDNLINIPNGGHAIWVLDPQLQVVHQLDQEFRNFPAPFPSPDKLRQAIAGHYTFRYFTRIDGAVWEIFGAAIQSAQFWRHQTPVRGYLLLGHRWDDAWNSQLDTLVGAHVKLLPADTPLAEVPHLHDCRRPLPGIDGQPIALLDVRFNYDLLETARQRFILRVVILSVVCMLAVAVLVAVIATVVLRPLGRIVRSLESRQTAPIADLLSSKTEFGEIARLLAGQLRWGQMLQEEMRRQLERANPERIRHEAESNEALRLRLAGNIHDGPIQSIYAAGLRLAAIQSEVEQGRAPAVERIVEINTILRQASADLRNLILELEPEELRERDLETALQGIERHLRQTANCAFELALTEGALDGLSREAQTHLYFICRELASNAVRHAHPTHARLQFSLDRGFLRLEWFNNGLLATPESAGGGHGLRNIERRVGELGGTIRQGPQKDGWRVACEIPLASLLHSVPRPALGP